MSLVPRHAAIVLSSFHPGGTEYQTIELMRRLDPARWRVHLACFHDEGAWRDRAAAAVTSVTEYPITSFAHAGTLGQMRRFARWCSARRIDVVHAADFYANVFALPAAAWAGVPARIGSRRELNPDKSPAQLVLQRLAYACAHRIVANSQAAAAQLRRERVPVHRITVVPNGLDLSRFHESASAGDGRTVIVLANLRPEKGHRILLSAAREVLARHPDTRFRLVGAGPERASLERRARDLGIAGAVEFLGYRPDVPELLSTAAVSVLPSTSEAFPNAAVESMAAGVPVVASAVGGLPEIVRHGHNGLLVPPADETRLADALSQLLDDRDLRARLGTEARADAARYSFDRMVSRVESLYLAELHRRSAPRATARAVAS